MSATKKTPKLDLFLSKTGSDKVLVALFTTLFSTGDGKKALSDALIVAAKYRIVNEFLAALGETLTNVGSGLMGLAFELYRQQEIKKRKKK